MHSNVMEKCTSGYSPCWGMEEDEAVLVGGNEEGGKGRGKEMTQYLLTEL